MSRRRPFLAVCALAVAPVLVALPAAGEPPTCQGQQATVVGTRGGVVRGTEGPDVIVVNLANEVQALGGDDRICSASRDVGMETSIDAGEGDDVVDTTGNVGITTAIDLGPGDDTYRGGDEADYVLGPVDAAAEGHDVISTGGGDDLVDTGGDAVTPDGDEVDLGSGDDNLTIRGALLAGQWTGGTGSDEMTFARFPQAGAFLVDNVAEQLTRDGATVARWSSFDRFRFEAGRTRDLSFRGSDRSERLLSLVGLDEVRLGGGDDVLQISTESMAGEGPMDLRGEAGDDLLALGIGYTSGAVDLQLGPGTLRFVRPGRTGATSSVRGFDRAHVVSSYARVVGTSRADRIRWNACQGSVLGAAGPDVLAYLFVEEDTCRGGGDLVVNGGRGDDRLVGGRLADRLIGGLGRDSADGRAGRDVCRAETEVRCES